MIQQILTALLQSTLDTFVMENMNVKNLDQVLFQIKYGLQNEVNDLLLVY